MSLQGCTRKSSIRPSVCLSVSRPRCAKVVAYDFFRSVHRQLITIYGGGGAGNYFRTQCQRSDVSVASVCPSLCAHCRQYSRPRNYRCVALCCVWTEICYKT